MSTGILIATFSSVAIFLIPNTFAALSEPQQLNVANQIQIGNYSVLQHLSIHGQTLKAADVDTKGFVDAVQRGHVEVLSDSELNYVVSSNESRISTITYHAPHARAKHHRQLSGYGYQGINRPFNPYTDYYNPREIPANRPFDMFAPCPPGGCAVFNSPY
jgi:hypothetical protein